MTEDFKIYYNKQIGSGAFANIYECENPQMEDSCCVKIMKLNAEYQQYYENEKQILELIRKIENPNLIKIYHICEQNQHLYVYMKKYKYNLEEWLTKKKEKNELFSVKDIMRMIHQIVNGYKTLYNNHIIHRDLKPENILVGDDGQLKISDFGLGKVMRQLDAPIQQTMLGTPIYASPQCLNDGIYSSKADVYSLGVLIYYITFQRNLFQAATFYELIKEQEKFKNTIVPIPEIVNEGIPEQIYELKDFFQLTITYHEDTRIEWPQLFEWFSEDRNLYQDQLLATQLFADKRICFRQKIESFPLFEFEETQKDIQVQKTFKKNQSLMKLKNLIEKKITFASNTLDALKKVKNKIKCFLTFKYLIIIYQLYLLNNFIKLIEKQGSYVKIHQNIKYCEKFVDSLIEECLQDGGSISEEVRNSLKQQWQQLYEKSKKEKFAKVAKIFDTQHLSISSYYKENLQLILKKIEVSKNDVDMIRFIVYSWKFCNIDQEYPIAGFKQIDFDTNLTDDVNQLIQFIEINEVYRFK